MTTEQVPSKERGCYVMDGVMYTSHADGSETSRKATDEEVLLADALLRATDELREPTPEVCCGDFDNCRRQCIPLVDELRRRATGEPPAVPARVRLLKDIYDDGQDHHPPSYIARAGEVLDVRLVHAIDVGHPGTQGGFRVFAGEFEPASSQPPSPVEETAWIIDYADVDRRPEHFAGFGAEAAARRRYDQAKQQWTCRLFRCVDESGYGTALTKCEGQS